MLRKLGLTFASIALVQVAVCHLHAVAEDQNAKPPKGYIVYSRFAGRWLPENTSMRYDLFLFKTNENKNPIRLTSKSSGLGAVLWYPAFSPDGKLVLFKAGPGKDLDLLDAGIYQSQFYLETISVTSRHLSQIQDKGNGYENQCWSLNSKFLSMSSTSKLTGLDSDELVPDDIFVYDRSKGITNKVARMQGYVSDLFWSPDGKNVLLQLETYEGKQDPNLYAVSRMGGKSRTLIKGQGDRFGYSFSPDGRKLAYIQDNGVYAANADGSNSSRVIDLTAPGTSTGQVKPKWSKSGDKLAAVDVVTDEGQKSHSVLHIYTPLDHKDKIVATLPQEVTDLIWSRNSQWLVLKTLSAGNTEKPDPKTGGYSYWRDGLVAVSVIDGHAVTLKKADEETKGLDWYEITE